VNRVPDFDVQPTVEANVVPPAPRLSSSGKYDGPQFRDWVRRTYAPGTRVKLLSVDFAEEFDLPRGAVGTAVEVRYGGMGVRVAFDRPVELFMSRAMERVEFVFNGEEIVTDLHPLDDNWGPQTIAAPRSYKGGWAPRTPRYKLTPNVRVSVPKPPKVYSRHWLDWYRRTYAPGTPVRFTDSGTRGEVVSLEVPSVSQAYLRVRVIDTYRDPVTGEQGDVMARGQLFNFELRGGYGAFQYEAADRLEPLVDNWLGLAGKPLARPRPNSARTSRRRTSRRGYDDRIRRLVRFR